VVGDVGIADVFEEEAAIIANEPAREGEQQLSKRGVNVEEVGSLQVVRSKLRILLILCCSVV
jgi:hypothetical protein